MSAARRKSNYPIAPSSQSDRMVQYSLLHNVSLVSTLKPVKLFKISFNLVPMSKDELYDLQRRIENFLNCFKFISNYTINPVMDDINNKALHITYYAPEDEGLALTNEISQGLNDVIQQYKPKLINPFNSFNEMVVKAKSNMLSTQHLSAQKKIPIVIETLKKKSLYYGVPIKKRVNIQIKRSKVNRTFWQKVRSLFKREIIRRKLNIGKR